MSDYSYFCGIDLAKNHFSVHAVDQNGKVLLHKSVTRSKLLTTIANMQLIRIDNDTCGGAHYWERVNINYAVAISKTVRHLFSITQSLDSFCLTRLSDMVAAELQQLFR